MNEKKLPKVLAVRVARILGRPVVAAYATDNPNVLKGVYADGGTAFVDLKAKQEIKQEVKQTPAGAETTFENVIMAEGVVEEPVGFITRADAVEEPKPKKKRTTKKKSK